MITELSFVVCATFAILAAWHFRMAFGKLAGESSAMPTVNGKLLFVPGSAFARLDALLYSPLCLALSVAIAFVA